MVTGAIGLCGQYVTNLVKVEEDQELDCVTTRHQSLVETNAMGSHWRQVNAMKQTAKVPYYCNTNCVYIYIYIYIYILDR